MKTFLPKISCASFLFFLAHIQYTQAQIIYTDVVPDSVFSAANGSLSVDLNHDGIIDFKLITNSKTTSSCGRGGTRINKYLRVTPADTNNSVFNYSNLPGALALNTTIDSSSQFWKHTASQLMAADTFRCSSFMGQPGWINIGVGNFRNTTNKYLAVRFYAGKQLYYGWIQFNITSKVTVTLKDYAYQSSGKQSILAGQTDDNYIFTPASKVSLLCAGDSMKIGVVLVGNFDPANVIKVELSDSVGNFIKGTVIGSDKVNISGTIPCKIPLSISGTGFRYRVTSSNPARNSVDNGTNLLINRSLPDSMVTPSITQVVCSGTVVALTAPAGNGNTYQWKKGGISLPGSVARNYAANATGLFSCDISNGCGTVHSNMVSLTILAPLSAINITPAGPLTINAGDSVLLSSSSVDPTLDYRWYRSNLLLNTLFSSMNYTAKIAGIYKLKITYPVFGCSAIPSGVTLYVKTVSAVPETYAVQSTIKVQPNPFSNKVSVSFSILDKQNFSVKIVDVAGRLVKTIATDVPGGGQFEYQWMADDQNGNAIKAGLYFLKLEAGTFSQTEKLILFR